MQAVIALNLYSARRGWGSDYLFQEDEDAAPRVPIPLAQPSLREGWGKSSELSCHFVAYQLQWSARVHVNRVPSA